MHFFSFTEPSLQREYFNERKQNSNQTRLCLKIKEDKIEYSNQILFANLIIAYRTRMKLLRQPNTSNHV